MSAASLCLAMLLLSVGYARSADRDVQVDTKSFRCITKLTPVRHFYVDNLLGDLPATVAAANSPTGAVYPPGSVIQLVPGEAMVKRANGFNAALQRTDARCDNPSVSPQDAEALKQLNELLKSR